MRMRRVFVWGVAALMTPPEVVAGMTEAEANVWKKVAAAAGAYLRLCDAEPHHGMEREEICHAFHVVQGWLSGRPFMRALDAAEGAAS